MSVVVLDEVGLAEDSPSLPLKSLHPLLEDGTTESKNVNIIRIHLTMFVIVIYIYIIQKQQFGLEAAVSVATRTAKNLD